MDKETQTSFIPKQILTKSGPRRREPTGLLSLIAIVVLIVSGLFFGGAYAYRQLLQAEISAPCDNPELVDGPGALKGCGLEGQLDKYRRRLDQALIAEFERTDNKMKRATQLLNDHQTFLPIFSLLESLTLETLRYNNFNYDGETVNLAGRARSFESIALQSEVFAADRRVKKYVFSDFVVEPTGEVLFKLVLSLDPAILSYNAVMEERAAAAEAPFDDIITDQATSTP